ncbi:MAG: gluconate 2-dehydrogenase subunit 3 family protein [Bacteroidota bacterium]
MDRREALKHSAVILGMVSASSVLGVMSGCKAGRTIDWKPSVLTEEQAKLVGDIAERIIPKSDTPGAIEAGVDAFIDAMLNGYLKEDEVAAFMTGLVEVDAISNSLYEKKFMDLKPEEQDAVLTEIAEHEDKLAGEARAIAFFPKIKELTITGYFTSELVAEKHLNYRPVPGQFVGCVDIAEVGNIVWAE